MKIGIPVSQNFVSLKKYLKIKFYSLLIYLGTALSRLLTSLKEVKGGEDVSFLSELLQSKQLHALVHVHNKIVAKGKDDRFFPLLSNSMEVALEVLELISDTTSPETAYKELFKLLQTPHMQVSHQDDIQN